jgi:hypothetical protein
MLPLPKKERVSIMSKLFSITTAIFLAFIFLLSSLLALPTPSYADGDNGMEQIVMLITPTKTIEVWSIDMGNDDTIFQNAVDGTGIALSAIDRTSIITLDASQCLRGQPAGFAEYRVARTFVEYTIPVTTTPLISAHLIFTNTSIYSHSPPFYPGNEVHDLLIHPGSWISVTTGTVPSTTWRAWQTTTLAMVDFDEVTTFPYTVSLGIDPANIVTGTTLKLLFRGSAEDGAASGDATRQPLIDSCKPPDGIGNEFTTPRLELMFGELEEEQYIYYFPILFKDGNAGSLPS